MTTLATALRRPRGFTLIELLIVISIMALASAGVAMALRDNSQTQLEREAQRLAALLDTARARSRASGVAVQWVTTPQGFIFTGLPEGSMPQQWLSASTQALPTPLRLNLGPEPVIGPQQLTLVNSEAPGRSLRLVTDGLRPFTVSNEP